MTCGLDRARLAGAGARARLHHAAPRRWACRAPPFDHFNLGLARRAMMPARSNAIVRLLVERAARCRRRRCWLRQVHGTRWSDRDSTLGPLLRGEPEADAAVTSTPGVVLAILTADCLPVLFAADDGSEIGAAHAGWRGLAAGVLENTRRRDAHRRRHACIAWLGPAAGPQAYEIGGEVFDAFVAHDRDAADAFVATRPGHWRVDLYALARRRLGRGAGVERIHGGGLCTISDPQRFYSHRRDQRGGRMATLVWIEPRE